LSALLKGAGCTRCWTQSDYWHSYK